MLGSKPDERIIRKPPVIAVEILSPDDRAGYLEEKINDYLAFGVPFSGLSTLRRAALTFIRQTAVIKCEIAFCAPRAPELKCRCPKFSGNYASTRPAVD